MYRILLRNTVYLSGSVVAPHAGGTLTQATETESFEVKWSRVKKIFLMNEFDEISPQLNTIVQTTFLTGFFGAFYGGFINGRDAYFKFIESNEATKFADHFEAKKKLQNSVTLGFGKGALRWGPRLALFGGFYISFVTIFAAYRGGSNTMDFMFAGMLSGAIYRLHMGLKAMIASGTLGGMMGLFAGLLSSLLFKISGNSLDDVHNYTKEITDMRNRHYNEATSKMKLEKTADKDLFTTHETVAAINNNESNPTVSH